MNTIQIKTITFYADNSSMGDLHPADCQAFREWAQKQIESEYPGYEVTVLGDESLITVHTNDDKNSDSIQDFCSRLWDNCDWEEIGNVDKVLGKTSVEDADVVWVEIDGVEYGINDDFDSESLQCDGTSMNCVDSESVAERERLAAMIEGMVDAEGGVDEIEWI